MTIATFAEASEMLGYSSPRTLYKLRKEGQLEDHLIEIQGAPKVPKGFPRLFDLTGFNGLRYNEFMKRLRESGDS